MKTIILKQFRKSINTRSKINKKRFITADLTNSDSNYEAKTHYEIESVVDTFYEIAICL